MAGIEAWAAGLGVDPATAGLLFLAAVVAGTFDAIAGGGGLLTVPALLLAGLDPVAAVATNKLQGCFGTCSATLAFARRGLIDWRAGLPVALVAAAASALGALSVGLVPRGALAALMPLALVLVGGYFLLSPRLREVDGPARVSPGAFLLIVPPVVGFYDGVFGPGAGSFYMVGFVALLGLGVVRATARTKLANAASNLGGFAVFAVGGAVVWPLGFVMAAGAALGAQIGSRLAVSLGARLVRPLLVVISAAMAARLLSDAENPLRRLVLGWLGVG